MIRIFQAVAFLSLVVTAAWADPTSLDVRATIRGACKIESIQPVDFGDLEGGPTAVDKTASGAVRYWCSKGLAYTITLGPGANPSGPARRMKGQAPLNADRLLPYTLVPRSLVTGTGRGAQVPEVLAIQGSLGGADYNGLPPGEFHDMVTVTITAPACCGVLGTVDTFGIKR